MEWPSHTDLVFPQGNEKELLLELKALGFRAAVLCYPEGKMPGEGLAEFARALSMTLMVAILIDNRKRVGQLKGKRPFGEVSGQIRGPMLIGPCKREYFEDKRFDALLGPGSEPRKDGLHYRRSLTQVEADLARTNGATVLFPLGDLLAAGAKGLERQSELLGRWQQDVLVLRKRKAPFALVSGARDLMGLRGRDDLERFF